MLSHRSSRALLLFSLLLTASIAQSQQSEPISEAMQGFTARGLGGTETRAIEADERGFVEFSRSATSKQRLYASRSLRLTFSLPVLGSNDKLRPVMSDITAAIEQACRLTGGSVEHVPYTYEGNDFFVQKAIGQVQNLKALGTHTCASGEAVHFLVDLYAARGSKPGILPGASRDWTIAIDAVYSDVFRRLETRLAASQAEAVAVRQTLAPGKMVAVAAKDLPSSARPKVPPHFVGYLSGNEYRVCAMVLQVQDNLVQIQIGTQPLFIQKDKILPFRRAIQFSDRLSGGWESWCVES